MTTTTTRGWAAGAAAVVLLLALVIFAVPAIAIGAPTASGGPCGPGGTAQTVAAVNLDADQMATAATIIATTQARALPPYAATVALATALQESKLRNITQAVNHDSLGVFQQRASYYTAAVAADPVKATNAFLDRLTAQPDWQTRPLTDVAADVQQPASGLRDRYAQWQPLAAQLTAQLWTNPTTGTPGTASPAAPCAGAAGTNPDTTTAAAPAPGPNGLTLTGSPAGNSAVGFALAQLGKPYLWGGTGPGRWDCSGLTMAAWAAAGVSIPRVSYSQATAGTPVSLQDARSGDLVLIPGSDGTPAHPGHVGMVAGTDASGKAWLVEAPRTGLNVRLSPLAGWATQIVTIRRIS